MALIPGSDGETLVSDAEISKLSSWNVSSGHPRWWNVPVPSVTLHYHQSDPDVVEGRAEDDGQDRVGSVVKACLSVCG